ncbi:MAG: bifunctional tetrahydrofolate synthase/dihydrofolate synthase [Pseudomonadota bacterium]|nr:bifunctional tetrahydrofolate synthase/dihydrofolate synthase [Pseudomonadota bacterium]
MPLPIRLNGWLEHIQSQHFRSIDLGLDRVRRVWHALGGYRPPLVIAVAGTNGKGSSVAMIESVLRAAGRHTGCYTSPHLIRYNERVRVDGVPAVDTWLCEAFERIEQARGTVGLTWFEFGTLAALLVFEQSGVEIAVLEVGMGGRLDAVNMVPNDVALITSIGLDHGNWLGRDRERVGGEKAGIIKFGGRVVCSDPEPPASIADQARKMQATLWQLGVDFRIEETDIDQIDGTFSWRSEAMGVPAGWRRLDGLTLPIPGFHQYRNAAGVIATLAVLPEQIGVLPAHVVRGLRRVAAPGRLQVVPGQPEILLDVCHNLESSEALAAWLRRNPVSGRVLAVFGVLRDKPVAAMVEVLGGFVDQWYIASLAGDRGQSAGALADAAGKGVFNGETSLHGTPVAAFEAARRAAEANDRIVVFGSFHTVGDIMRVLELSS